jgi:hypothetical protein
LAVVALLPSFDLLFYAVSPSTNWETYYTNKLQTTCLPCPRRAVDFSCEAGNTKVDKICGVLGQVTDGADFVHRVVADLRKAIEETVGHFAAVAIDNVLKDLGKPNKKDVIVAGTYSLKPRIINDEYLKFDSSSPTRCGTSRFCSSYEVSWHF